MWVYHYNLIEDGNKRVSEGSVEKAKKKIGNYIKNIKNISNEQKIILGIYFGLRFNIKI